MNDYKTDYKTDGNDGLDLAGFTEILQEISQQPAWRANADKEMDYADGNQLDGELVQRQRSLGIPPAIENLIGPALLSVQGFEAKNRTDWRVSADSHTQDDGGTEVAEALNYRLNQTERHSRADHACTDAFRSQIGVGIGWVEVSRESDPFKYPYKCNSVHRNEIHWDMAAREPDLADARYMVRKRWMHRSRVIQSFGQHKELIRQCTSGWSGWLQSHGDGEASTGLSKSWEDQRGWSIEEQMWHNTNSQHVCIFEVWSRCWHEATILRSPDGRIVQYDKKNPAHTIALATGASTPSKASIPKIRRSYWLGPHLLDDSPSPYTHRHFPYVPFWCFREDRTGIPFGFIRGMMYQQDALNSGTSKMRWGMSSVRTERTKGAVDMSDEHFRQMIARVDADIVLDQQEMAKPGAVFKVTRDFQMNEQQYKMLNDARAAIERVSAITSGFSGKRGSATSGLQEQTQVEQSNQTLASVMDSFRRGRSTIGEMLLSFIVDDMGDKPVAITVDGDAVSQPKQILLNQPQSDADAGYEYLSNDVQRARLKVALEDVPTTSGYRAQQLNAMSESIKSLPPQYQVAMLPFLVALMDVPFKEKVIDAVRDVGQQETPEAVAERIKRGIAEGVTKAGLDIRAKELELKYSPEKLKAEIAKIVSETVESGVRASFSAMQAAQTVATLPAVAPVADVLLQNAGWQAPIPAGQDPNIPQPDIAMPAPQDVSMAAPGDTSPQTPASPTSPEQGVNRGINTMRADSVVS